MARRFFYDTEFIEYPSTIDLLSIGVVAEDGREFYAVNVEADVSKANAWVQDNVLPHLIIGGYEHEQRLSRENIRRYLFEFLLPSKDDPVELWGYYADYDHVALCWLFGRMVDLPPGMPMYTRDIKQFCDDVGNPRLPGKPETEHNALSDARWNLMAWRFLYEQLAEQAAEA